MPDTPPPPIPQEEESPEQSPFAERFAEFIDALESLYISGNLSGRVHFREAWPAVAEHIFGAELIKYDEDGAPDKEHRAVLEDEADQKRITLVERLEDVEENSIYHGSLQAEYASGIIHELGRKLSLYIYTPHVVDNIIPPEPGEEPVEEAAPEESVQENTEQDIQSEDLLAPTPPADEVQPIDMSSALAPDDDIKPIETSVPSVEDVPPPGKSGSGLDLGTKRNIIQVDFIHSQPISYNDLLKAATEVEDESLKAPSFGMETATDPPAPPLKTGPSSEETSDLPAPSTQNAPPIKMLFNHFASGRVE